jgi:hypothetical protein
MRIETKEDHTYIYLDKEDLLYLLTAFEGPIKKVVMLHASKTAFSILADAREIKNNDE